MHNRDTPRALRQDNNPPGRSGKSGKPPESEHSGCRGQDWYNGGKSAPMTDPAGNDPQGHQEPPREDPNRLDDDPNYGDDREAPIKPNERPAGGTSEK
ncbi:MAG: hypothetical protein ACKVP5_03290 [Aestuariivirga sp.]